VVYPCLDSASNLVVYLVVGIEPHPPSMGMRCLSAIHSRFLHLRNINLYYLGFASVVCTAADGGAYPPSGTPSRSGWTSTLSRTARFVSVSSVISLARTMQVFEFPAFNVRLTPPQYSPLERLAACSYQHRAYRRVSSHLLSLSHRLRLCCAYSL
jgi:hypothetical protein